MKEAEAEKEAEKEAKKEVEEEVLDPDKLSLTIQKVCEEIRKIFEEKGQEIAVLSVWKYEIQSLNAASASAAKGSSDLLTSKDAKIAAPKEEIHSLKTASAAAAKVLEEVRDSLGEGLAERKRKSHRA